MVFILIGDLVLFSGIFQIGLLNAHSQIYALQLDLHACEILGVNALKSNLVTACRKDVAI